MAGRFDFEITERIAVLSSNSTYSTELNRVSFNGYPAKLDLRRWKDGQPLKGVQLTDDEARSLIAALLGLDFGEGTPDGKQAEPNSGK